MTEKLTLKSITQEIERLSEEMKIKASEGISKIFEIYPEVSAVSWTQYVPYFSDGDPCVFQLGEIYVLKGNVSEELIQEITNNPYYPEEYGEEDELWKDVEIIPYSDTSAKSISNFINSISDELEKIYDSNASVVLSREYGTKIEDYEPPY